MSGSQWIVQGVLDHSHHDALAILVTVVRRRVIFAKHDPSGSRSIGFRIMVP